MSNKNLLTVLALATAAVLGAQESTRLSGPTSGFLYDAPSRSFRVVMGVPGAAYLGQPVADNMDAGAVSPDGKLGLGISNGEAVLVSFGAAEVARTPLGAAGNAGAIVWNETSNAVAVANGGAVSLFRIGAGNAASRVALAELPGSGPMAVDNSGNAVYVAAANGVYRVDGEAARLIAPVENASAIAMANNVLYIADRTRHEITAVTNAADAAEARLALSAAQGIDEPVALGASRDGSRLYVAEKARALNVFNPNSAELVARVELDFEPARVDAVGNSLYLLNARAGDGDTLQVLDARQLAVYFVPTADLSSVANLED